MSTTPATGRRGCLLERCLPAMISYRGLVQECRCTILIQFLAGHVRPNESVDREVSTHPRHNTAQSEKLRRIAASTPWMVGTSGWNMRLNFFNPLPMLFLSNRVSINVPYSYASDPPPGQIAQFHRAHSSSCSNSNGDAPLVKSF
jgi:hypothetical protein